LFDIDNRIGAHSGQRNEATDMTTDLITLRRDILDSGEKCLQRLMATDNDSLPGIEVIRAKARAGVEHARKQYEAAWLAKVA